MIRVHLAQLKTAIDSLTTGAREFDHWPVAEGFDLVLVQPVDRKILLADEGELLLEAARRAVRMPLAEMPGIMLLDVLEAFRLQVEHLGDWGRRVGLFGPPEHPVSDVPWRLRDGRRPAPGHPSTQSGRMNRVPLAGWRPLDPGERG